MIRLLLFITLLTDSTTIPWYEDNLKYQWNEYEWVQVSESANIADLLAGQFDDQMAPSDSLRGTTNGRYWLKLYFPTFKDSTTYFVDPINGYHQMTVYTSGGDAFSNQGYVARDTNRYLPGQIIFKLEKQDLFEGKYVLVDITNYKMKLTRFYFQTLNEAANTYENNFIPKRRLIWYEFGNICFLGAMLIVFLYVVAIYSFDRKPLYLFYLLYIATMGLFLFSRSPMVVQYIIPIIREQAPTFEVHVRYTFQYLGHFAYLWFGIHFLRAWKDYPLFFKVGNYFSWIFLGTAAFTFFAIEFNPTSTFWLDLNDYERILAILFTIGIQVYVLAKRKNELALFLVIGSILFITGAVLAMVQMDVIYMRVGTMGEVFTFSLGLAYRIRISEREKRSIQDQLIKESGEREKLQSRYNEELKEEVRQRSEELVQQRMAVEQEKKKALKLSLEREIDRVKMIALRTQMKPHFLFNAINSIRALIIKKDTDAAYKALLIFSKLIRYILESSEQDAVTLKEEIDMLNIYVSLEKMRLSDDFTYQLEIAEELQIDSVRLPPLILQPFIENAILHGLQNKEGEKHLLIRISKDGGSLKCIVSDNGVGRSFANQRKISDKKSMAIELTRNRINLLHTANGLKEGDVEIVDKVDGTGNPMGTDVIVSLPLIEVL